MISNKLLTHTRRLWPQLPREALASGSRLRLGRFLVQKEIVQPLDEVGLFVLSDVRVQEKMRQNQASSAAQGAYRL
jgi:hypothetical protein